MRVGKWGLPLLAAATVLAVSVPPAFAGGQGEVGVEGGVIVVRAEESLPGRARGGADDPECVWDVAIADDSFRGVYSVDGDRLFSDTGRWLQNMCAGGPVEINGFFVVPEGGGFSLRDMLAQAVDALDPTAPLWGSSPDGVDVAMVVQMPTWLWIEPAYWAADFSVRVASPSGRVWAEAHAVPVSTLWELGDGTTVTCAGPGEPFAANAGEPSCSHVFEHSTAGTNGLEFSVTVTFNAMGSTSLNLTPIGVGQVSRTSEPVVVIVGEIQAIETG